MAFNSSAYLKDQVRKQYHDAPTSSVEVKDLGERFSVRASLTEEMIKTIVKSDVDQLQKHVKEGDVSYEDIATVFFNRILDYASYHAVISLNRDVIEEARQCSYSDTNDPLYGLPVLLKDNIATKTLPTTAGAAILKDYYPKEDADIVRSLKEKGALILGKVNLSEWANFMSTDSANGYSAVGGQTRHPAGEFDVGGSSSGSAVAISLNVCPVAIGTETAGSIIYPASQNGVVGLKPTWGLVSQSGIIPLAEVHDTAGPMAHTVRDCFYGLRAITDVTCDMDTYTSKVTEYRFGFLADEHMKSTYRDDDEEILRKFKQILKDNGVDYTDVMIAEAAYDIDIMDVLTYQFKEGVRTFFKHETIPLTLSDVYYFNERDLKNYAPHGQDLIKQSIDTSLKEEVITKQVLQHQGLTKKVLDQAFEEVDILVTLSNYATTLYAPSGYPTLTLPGFKRSTGEPVGVTFIAPASKDSELLYVGTLIEALIK